MLKTRKLLVLISILLAVLFLIEVPVSAVAPVLNTELASNEPILEEVNDTDEQPESVNVSELEDYEIYGNFVTCNNNIKGKWNVSFMLRDK